MNDFKWHPYSFMNGWATALPEPSCSRPSHWAQPVTVNKGLPNLHRINASLYRAAQPTREGFEFLTQQQAGFAADDHPIKTVLSLRSFTRDTPLMPADAQLRLEQIPFIPWQLKIENVVKFLRIVTTPALQPVLVHCQHGADRTGTMVAIYRIVFEEWSKAHAVEEMVKGGFGYHLFWKNLPRYIDELDIEAIRAEVEKQGPWC